MQELKVRKLDGTTEPWNYDKLAASISKAGVEVASADTIAKQVEEWVKANAQNGVISSNEVRDKVIELMSIDFPAESDSYKSFKKS